tara:strand:+ start:339 stop:1211 length:873 start_codon:yes stop_codon:yes gene_type:complete
MATSFELMNTDYEEQPLDRVKELYSTKRIRIGTIFKRFEKLGYLFSEIPNGYRSWINRSEKLTVQLGDLTSKFDESLIKYNSLKEENSRTRNSNTHDKKTIDADLEETISQRQGLLNKIKETKEEITESKEKIVNYLTKKSNFERDFAEEMDYVYSKRYVNENFARLRLIKPGKFRMRELSLMVQYGILDAEEVFDSEHINAIDIEILVSTKYPDKDEYIIPIDLIKARLESLPKRMKGISEMINDMESLNEMGKKTYDIIDNLNSKSHDLLYEENVLKDCVKNRESQSE